MAENLVTVNDSTLRMYPRHAPLHDSLDGLSGHPPTAASQAAGLVPRTDGADGYELVALPDPYTSAGAILGATRVAPAEATDRTVTTAEGDYDAPTLACSFTVPASGDVVVDLDATHLTSAAATVAWFLRQSGTIVAGSVVTLSGTTTPQRQHATIIVTGLTPSANLTWTWGGQAITGGTTSTLRVGGGDTPGASIGGQATMIVRDAP